MLADDFLTMVEPDLSLLGRGRGLIAGRQFWHGLGYYMPLVVGNCLLNQIGTIIATVLGGAHTLDLSKDLASGVLAAAVTLHGRGGLLWPPRCRRLDVQDVKVTAAAFHLVMLVFFMIRDYY